MQQIENRAQFNLKMNTLDLALLTKMRNRTISG